MRVALFEPYPFGKIAGNLRTQIQYLQYVDRDRFDIVVLSPSDGGFVEVARGLGAHVGVFPPPPPLDTYGGELVRGGLLTRLRGLIALFRYTRTMIAVLKDGHYDVVYCNGVRGTLLLGPAARLAGVPVLMYVKGALQSGVLDVLALFLAKRILFFSESNRDDRYPWAIRVKRAQVGILPTGVDVEEIDRKARAGIAEPALVIDPQRLNVAVIAQLYPTKGIDILLDVLPQLVAEHPRLHLYVIGDEIIDAYELYAEGLRRSVVERGLSDWVTFTGWRDDALAIVSKMDLVVHPARREGFGRAVLEAMTLGRCVAASAVGALREFIDPWQNGVLFPPESPAELFQAVSRLLSDEGERVRIGRAARRSVVEKLGVRRHVHRMELEWEALARESARAEG